MITTGFHFPFCILHFALSMRVASRRKAAIFFLAFGICLVALAVALNVGWILLNLQQIALLVFGIIFFAVIITGLVLNTIFLVREIRRNEQHDAFLNAVTHELKTPIASIQLYLQTLKKRDVTEAKRQEFYDVMLSDSNRLLNTVEQVLQASGTRERARLLNITEIELGGLLRESIRIIQTRYNLNESVIELTETADEVKVSGDNAELQTVFTNLLDNAVKYSRTEVKVLIKLERLPKNRAEIRIKDNGVGISPNERKRIFKRFYRAPNLSTQKAKGTGLGLYIVRSIVKKHKGKIFVESDGEGKGSTFIVQLPQIKGEL
ncbi:MAG: HAMP domain-containing histidine kinase [Acidobacteria bacterium]|nr:HAMP domain-containing histidine kinase [Acidobacteriota bacterium]MCA1637990.1 HAMP domain-containing histidine kinase [Acidobacteriota bacterium]